VGALDEGEGGGGEGGGEDAEGVFADVAAEGGMLSSAWAARRYMVGGLRWIDLAEDVEWQCSGQRDVCQLWIF